jgi:hypothetical protein
MTDILCQAAMKVCFQPTFFVTRLTNAFSKKLSHLKAACALHFAHYNFCRVHQTLRVTPAMAAGVADHIFSIEEIVDLLYRSGTIAA